MLLLDHASLDVSDLSSACPFLESGLGFNVTLTPQALRERGRIFLDRGYVELSQTLRRKDVPGRRSPPSSWRGYFLRTADPATIISEARARGVEFGEPAIYHGRDVDWAANTMLRTIESPLRFADGKRIVVGYPEGSGAAEAWLDRNGPGIFAAGLGTRDLEQTESYLRQKSPAAAISPGGNAATLWLAPGEELDSHMYFS